MIGTLIGLFVLMLVLGLFWWGIQRVMAVLTIAEPFKTLAYVFLVIIVGLIAIWLLIQLLQMAGVHVNTFGLR